VPAAGTAAALYVAAGCTGRTMRSPCWAGKPFALKSLLATVALGMAAVQVVLACGSTGSCRLRGSLPLPVRLTHRIAGFGLFALTVPIAVHCLIAYLVQLTSVRVAVYSLAGCFFYGAFVAKELVQTRRLPGWVLSVAGRTLAVVVGVLWYSSALWYYNGFRLPHLRLHAAWRWPRSSLRTAGARWPHRAGEGIASSR
jgi:hypothetical protein